MGSGVASDGSGVSGTTGAGVTCDGSSDGSGVSGTTGAGVTLDGACDGVSDGTSDGKSDSMGSACLISSTIEGTDGGELSLVLGSRESKSDGTKLGSSEGSADGI